MSNVTLDHPLPTGWSVDIRSVTSRSDLSIDPKRWCEKVATVRKRISKIPHFSLHDVADIIFETGVPKNVRAVYQYVEIQDTSDGIVTPTTLRGWQLPDRAKHTAQPGDIFVGGIWGSVGKWFIAGGDCTTLVVSNGFRRVRLKANKQEFLIDILAGLNTEAYRIQARAFATGSDGLAEVSEGDLLEIVLPQITDPDARLMLQQLAEALLAGRATVASMVEGLRQQRQIPNIKEPIRSTHWVQV
jgi:type I restriction enzyme M protein